MCTVLILPWIGQDGQVMELRLWGEMITTHDSGSTPVHSDAFWNKNRILRQMQQEVSIKPPFFAFDSGIKSGHLTCQTPNSNCLNPCRSSKNHGKSEIGNAQKSNIFFAGEYSFEL